MGDRPCFTLLQWIPAVGEGSGGGEEGKGGAGEREKEEEEGEREAQKGFRDWKQTKSLPLTSHWLNSAHGPS